MKTETIEQGRAFGVTLRDLVREIEARNALRAAHHLPQLDIVAELPKAVNEIVIGRCRAFARAHTLHDRFRAKIVRRDPRWCLSHPQARYGVVAWIYLDSLIQKRVWRAFEQAYGRDLATARGWVRYARTVEGPSAFSLLQARLKV
jgi:hypothetical protein